MKNLKLKLTDGEVLELPADGVARCSTCGVLKPLETAFYGDKSRPSGKSHRCKDCEAARQRYRTSDRNHLIAHLTALASVSPGYQAVIIAAAARLQAAA